MIGNLTYEELHDNYLTIAAKLLRDHLIDIVSETPHIDSVNARAKSPIRFKNKAEKTTEEGSPKYTDPLNEIQDVIGARIIVFYLHDVETVRDVILKYLSPIELQSKQPLNDSEFGYVGEHFVLRLPEDTIPDEKPEHFPEFFELQIKTLFQHAWSEAHHDLGYKSHRPLTSLEKRKIAFTAAQAWGADTIFEELSKDLSHDI